MEGLRVAQVAEKVSSVADLVPWLFPVSESIVACKDSSLLATYEITGMDIDSTDVVHIDAVLSRLDRAYHAFSVSGCSVWINVMRYTHDEVVSQRFANPVAQKVYDLHSKALRASAPYRMRAYISVLMPAPKGAAKLFANISERVNQGDEILAAAWHGLRISFSSRYAFAYRREQLVAACQEFERTLDTVLPTVPELGLRRLKGPEFFGFLRAFVSDTMRPEDALPLEGGALKFFDALLPDATMEVGVSTLRYGRKYLAALSLKEWPSITAPEIVRTILTEDANVNFSFGFKMLGQAEAQKTLKRIRQYAEVTRFRLIDYIMAMRTGGAPAESKASAAKQRALEEAVAAEQEFDLGDIAIGYANMTILVEGESEQDADMRANRLRKRLSLLMPGIVREELHLVSAFSAVMPGQFTEPVRWAIATTRNLADATWFLLPRQGEATNKYFSEQLRERSPSLAVLPTEWRTPYHFNFHDGALGHTMVIGPSRSGKTVLVNFLISQWLKYEPCHVVIFDKDKSCKITTMLHGGVHYDLDPERPMKLNPMALVADRRHHSFLVDWITNLIEMRGYHATAEDTKAISEGIEEIHVNGSPDHYRLVSLYNLLPQKLKLQLTPYVQGGQYAYMFDNAEDAFSIAGITCIEMGDLLRTPAVAAPFIDYAFYRVMDMLEQNRSAGARPSPTLIYLEECWFLLDHPLFASRIRDWLKTLAKMNAALVMTTQSLDDMANGDPKVFAAIRDNIPTKIMLPNAKARTESLRRVYRDYFGMDDYYVDRIADAAANRNYLIIKPDHAKMIEYRFTPEQLLYLRSDSAALAIFEDEYSKGPGWESRYLRRCAEEL